jgi:CRISPR-associated protein Csb3
MAAASIPVDLYNPGQVFACLGFLEAASVLLDDAEGGFEWSDTANVFFRLRANGEENPFAVTLEFLATVTPKRWAPVGFVDRPPNKGKIPDMADEGDEVENQGETVPDGDGAGLDVSEIVLAAEGDRMSLPIRFGGGNWPVVELGHWADGSSRNSFKLYAGNRSAHGIACAMLLGVREKPKKNQTLGTFRTKGIRQLWDEQREELIARPLDVLTPMAAASTLTRAGPGPRLMPAIHRMTRVIRSKPPPSSNSSPHGAWRMRVLTNSKRVRFATRHGVFRFRPCWRAPPFAVALPPCRSSIFVSGSTCPARTRLSLLQKWRLARDRIAEVVARRNQ